MRATLKRFLTDRTGATAIEYGLIVAVLSLAVVSGIGNFSNSLQNMFGHFANTLDDSWN
jgi:pilus assembly protein Flp/PilA